MADDRWTGPHGIGRFSREVLSRLGDWRPVPVRSHPLRPWDPWLTGRAVRRLPSSERPSVYFSPLFNPPRRPDVPVVFTLHDLIHLDTGGLGHRSYYRLVVQPATREAAAILTVSQHVKRQIVEHFRVPAERVVVVGNGVSEAFHVDGPRQDGGRPYLLCVAPDRPHKNVHRLIEAFAASGLAPTHDLHLTAQPSRALHDTAMRHGVSPSVHHIVAPDDADVAAAYRGAAAVIVPSLDEGFGLPAVEALACGSPLLAADAGALPEVVGDAAVLFDPRQVEAMAEAMGRVIGDETLRQRLRILGPERAKRYMWDAVAHRVMAALGAATST